MKKEIKTIVDRNTQTKKETTLKSLSLSTKQLRSVKVQQEQKNVHKNRHRAFPEKRMRYQRISGIKIPRSVYNFKYIIG